MNLPLLREELDLMPGPRLPDGQPSWTLHDPARNRFFRIDWLTFEILSRWSLGENDTIVDSIATSTTLHPDAENIKQVVGFLEENDLLAPKGTDVAKRFAARLQHAQGSMWKWVLHRYLFFRLPLLQPDRWLQRLLPWVEAFYSRTFLRLTLLALVLGLALVARHYELFITTLVDTFTLQGLLSYGLALVVVKFLHELGHAFTAKRYGCRIPTIGIAFLVLWPMAYTDTNDVWRLTNRWQRLHVSCAGIFTELIIAAWATLAWGLLPDGDLRSAAFVLASTSWIATLVINASPFLRFDGYFIVCDLLDMPNLHGRCFALARWKLREWLFALGEPKPEHFSPRKERWLIVFAWVTWMYRLLVFIAIALLVYHFFIKALGILLFVVEVAWFIVLPVWGEIREWLRRWPTIRQQTQSRRRALRSLLLAAGVLLLFLVPWPGRISASALLRPTVLWQVHAPGASRVEAFEFREGSVIPAGALVIELTAPELQAQLRMARARVESARQEAAASGVSDVARERLLVNQQEWAQAEAELASVQQELQRYTPVAPFQGRLRNVDPELQVGQWLEANEPIAVLVGEGPLQVETYLDEEAVKRIYLGGSAVFISDSREGGMLKLRVSGIDADATRVLPNGMLSAPAGGHILTRNSQGRHVPEQAVYHVVFTVEEPVEQLADQIWRGRVTIDGTAEAPALRYMRNVLAVLVRESGW